MKKKKKHLLFVCYGNICRSPMAEGIARKRLGASAEVASAGIGATGGPAAEEAVLVMKLVYGQDISSHIARPVVLSRTFPRTSVHLQFLALANQSEKVGDTLVAEAYYDKALRLVPENPEATAYYCGFLMRTRQFERALSLIETVKADPTLQFDYYIIKGKALRELGRCEEAIPLLEAGNKLYNSDTRLLNALGYCYYKTGQKAQALEALNASLRLNPDQADTKALVEEIKTR